MQNYRAINYKLHCGIIICGLEAHLFDTIERRIDGHVKMRIMRQIRWVMWDSFSHTNNFIEGQYKHESN
jgi:hypothetical protein